MARLQDSNLDTSGNEGKDEEESQLLYHCDMCCSKVTDSASPNFDIPQEFCTGSPQSLRNHLFAYFIITKLLKVSKVQYFEAVSAAALSTLVFNTRFCGNCHKIINKALETHIQLLDLQREISELGEALSKSMQQRRGTSGGKRKATKSYFQAILETACSHTGSNHEHKVIQVMEIENSAKVKQEITASEEHKYFDGFNDFDESSNASPPPTHSSMDDNYLCSMSSDDEDANQRNTRGSDNKWRPDDVVDSKQLECHEDNCHVFISPNENPGSEPNYACEICSASFQRPLNLRRHMKAHEDSTQLYGNKYDCPQCKYPAVSEHKLRYHLTKAHKMKIDRSYDDNEEFHGNDQDEDFDDEEKKSELNRTNEVTPDNDEGEEEKDNENYPCKLCDTVYQRRLGYRRHMEAHRLSTQLHGNMYDCPRCKYPALSENKRRFHLAKIHKVKEDKEVEITSKRNNLSETLDVSNYDGEAEQESSYPCKLCETIYQRRLGYRRHMEAHKVSSELHGNKYDCPQCKYPCLSENKLRFHLAKIHKIKDESHKITSKPKKRKKIQESDDSDDSEEEVEERPKSKYACNICGTVYKARLGYRRHVQAHKLSTQLHKNKYDCPECKYPALSEFKLKFHLSQKHNSKENNTCAVCGFQGERRYLYEKHMLQKHGVRVWTPMTDPNDDEAGAANVTNTDPTYPCDRCTMIYKSDRGIREHKRDHQWSEENNHKFDCNQCGYPARSDRVLRTHKTKYHHSARSTLQCTLCDFTAKTNVKMSSHMFHKHSDGNKKSYNKVRIRNRSKWLRNLKNGKFVCDLCQAGYTHSETLRKHMTFHEKTKRELGGVWDCKKCGYPTISEEVLNKHMTSAHNREHLRCERCQKGFTKASILKMHMRIHKRCDRYLNPTTGVFHCKLCDFQTKSMNGFLLHNKTHAEENQPAPISPSGGGEPGQEVDDGALEEVHLCAHCGNSFNSKARMKAHVRQKHEGIYRFYCEYCSKGYGCIRNLNEHLLTHDKNRVMSREHVCHVCGADYLHQRSLLAHIAKFHGRDGMKARVTTNKMYRCRWCNNEFQYKSMLAKHLPADHADLYKFSCDLCTKSYMSGSSLRLHKEIAHKMAYSSESKVGGDGEEGGKEANCEYCGKQFTHRHHVICHYRFCSAKRQSKYSSAVDAQCSTSQQIFKTE